MSKVFVVIAVKDRLEYTKQCLKSLGEQTYKDIQTIIIDCGSVDGTGEYITKNYPNVKIIKSNSNVWWTQAMNLGIDYVLKHSNSKDDYVLIQNNDTYMQEDYIEEIVRLSEKYNSIIGTSVRDYKTNELIYNCHRLIKYGYNKYVENTKEEIIQTDTISGRGALIPIEVFHKIGKFSKYFPHYAADYDFFFRAKKKGYKLLMSNNVVTYNTQNNPGLSKRLKDKDKLTIKEFYDLFFHRRSSNNLYSSSLLTLLHNPGITKVIGLLKIYLLFVKVFIKKVIL